MSAASSNAYSRGTWVAIGGMGSQAISSVLTVVSAKSLLGPAEFSAYSLSLSVATIIASLAFEWIRLGAMRMLSSSEAGNGEFSSVVLLCGSAICLLIASGVVWSIAGGVHIFVRLSIWPIIILCIGQGTSDLVVSIVRVRGDLFTSTILIGTRSAIIAVLTYLSLEHFRSWDSAIWASSVVYALTTFFGLFALAVSGGLFLTLPSRAHVRRVVSYGIPASAAAQVHLLSTFALRSAVPLLSSDPSYVASYFFALDLFQRPFAMISTLCSTLFFPMIVQQHDLGRRSSRNAYLSLYLLYMIALSIFGLLTIAIALPAVARVLAPAEVDIFSRAGLAISVYMFLLLHLQSTVAIFYQISLRTRHSFAFAMLQLMCAISLILFAVRITLPVEVVFYGAGVATSVILIGAATLSKVDFRQFSLPAWREVAILIVICLSAIIVASYFAPTVMFLASVGVVSLFLFLPLFIHLTSTWQRRNAS